MPGIDPLKYYERRGRHSEEIQLMTYPRSPAVGSNQVIPATTGKIIRVMGYSVQTNTSGQGSYLFTNGSGGSALGATRYAPPNTAEPFLLPVIDSGYFECDVSTDLYATVGTAVVNFEIYYILYTP